MITIYIILGMIAYLVIGGFVSGLFDKDIRAIYVVFWPLFMFISAVFLVFWVIYTMITSAAKFGRFLVKKWS